MANTIKVTKMDNFKEIESVLREIGKDTLADVMVHEMELLAKKNANRKPKAETEEIKMLREKVLDTLKDYPKGLTVGDVLKASGLISKDVSSQKMSALMNKMVTEGVLAKNKDKRKSIFTLVA